MFVLEMVPLRSEKNLSHTHKTGSWYLIGVLFKISNKHPCTFYMEVPPLGGYMYMHIRHISRKSIRLHFKLRKYELSVFSLYGQLISYVKVSVTRSEKES